MSADASSRVPVAALSGLAQPQRGSPWIGVTGVLLLVTLLVAAFVQARQIALINSIVRGQNDSAAVGLQQLERQSLRLRESLRKAADGSASPLLTQRYNGFIDSLARLGSGPDRSAIQQFESGSNVMQGLDSFVQRAAPYLQGELPGAPSPQAAQALLDELEALDAPIEQLMLGASRRAAAQIDTRQSQVRNHHQIGLALTGMLLAMVTVFAVAALRLMHRLEQRCDRSADLADQLRDARSGTESTLETKNEFLTDLSHGLRAPLQELQDMLMRVRESPRDRRTRDWLKSADESGQQLSRRLADIHDLSQRRSGALKLAAVEVELHGLLHDVRQTLLPSATTKGLDLQVVLDPAAESSCGLLDHAKLRSVRDLMGVRQVPTLYGGFFVRAEDAARDMREALRDADPEALRRNARIVKVVAFKLGLPGLAAAATLLSREAGTRTATRLALQRFEELTVATRALCARQGLLN